MHLSLSSQSIIKWEHFNNIESTNDYALKAEHSNETLLISADYQSKGRGRKQQQWVNTEKSLLFSLLTPLLEIKNISNWPVNVAITLAQTLSKLTQQTLWIKWPNDLYIGNNLNTAGKFCGILIETVLNSKQGKVITGVGINLAPVEQTLTNDYETSFLNTILSKKDIMTNLIEALLITWEKTLASPFINCQTYQLFDYLYHKMISATHPITKKTLCGLAKGVNEQGHLLIQTQNRLIALTELHQIRTL